MISSLPRLCSKYCLENRLKQSENCTILVCVVSDFVTSVKWCLATNQKLLSIFSDWSSNVVT
jgi:hypothetical protein